jgi:hypothetical protein
MPHYYFPPSRKASTFSKPCPPSGRTCSFRRATTPTATTKYYAFGMTSRSSIEFSLTYNEENSHPLDSPGVTPISKLRTRALKASLNLSKVGENKSIARRESALRPPNSCLEPREAHTSQKTGWGSSYNLP